MPTMSDNSRYLCVDAAKGGDWSAAREMFAGHAKGAALQYAETIDFETTEYNYANGGGDVLVKDENGKVLCFTVGGETRIVYHGHERKQST